MHPILKTSSYIYGELIYYYFFLSIISIIIAPGPSPSYSRCVEMTNGIFHSQSRALLSDYADTHDNLWWINILKLLKKMYVVLQGHVSVQQQ